MFLFQGLAAKFKTADQSPNNVRIAKFDKVP